MIIDLTQSFQSHLQQSPPSPPSPPSSPHLQRPSISIQSQLCNKQSTQILHNLTKITTILQQNKQNYFSNAAYSYESFTDQQRNQFDKEMKKLIDNVNIKINQMNQVIKRVKFYGITEKEHFNNMVICLYQRYRKISDQFRMFMQFNQNRKIKIQSMLGNQIKQAYKTHKPIPTPITDLPFRQSSPDPQLHRQSIQIYQERMSQQKKIQETKKTLQQINGILDIMQNKVLEQQLLTSSFRQIGQIGLFHIDKGNKNLVDANVLAKDTGKMWTLFFLGLALSLLVLDYIKS